MNWINVKDRLPEIEGVYSIKTEGNCLGKSLFEKGSWDYDLQCQESVSVLGIGTPDKVICWIKK